MATGLVALRRLKVLVRRKDGKEERRKDWRIGGREAGNTDNFFKIFYLLIFFERERDISLLSHLLNYTLICCFSYVP